MSDGLEDARKPAQLHCDVRGCRCTCSETTFSCTQSTAAHPALAPMKIDRLNFPSPEGLADISHENIAEQRSAQRRTSLMSRVPAQQRGLSGLRPTQFPFHYGAFAWPRELKIRFDRNPMYHFCLDIKILVQPAVAAP